MKLGPVAWNREVTDTNRIVADFDARLIRQARELAACHHVADKRAWLAANDRPEAVTADDATVNAAFTGAMAYALTVLANGYERELTRGA